MGGVIGDAGEDIGEPSLGIDVIHLGGDDETIDERGALATAIGAGEQPCPAPEGNRAVILPMSGRKLKFVTGGTPSMGGGFDASMLSGAPAARSFTSKWRPAWSSWWRHGCSIPPPAPEWHSAHRGSRYRRWMNCIGS